MQTALAPQVHQATRDPTPAYYRIFRTLRRRIVSGAYAVAAQLPTEEELMREFSVSRHTIRAAVQQLVVQGLVRRQAGKGTFVLKASDDRQWAAQSLDDMVERFYGEQIDDAEMTLLPSGGVEEMAARGALGTSDRVVRFTWRRSLADGPCTIATVFVPQSFAAALPVDWSTQLEQRRLLHLIEDGSGVEAFRVRQSCTAIPADAEAARLLDVPEGSPLLQLLRSYYDRAGSVIEYSRTLGRPDRCEQVVELFRAGH